MLKILVKEGETVAVGAVVAKIDTEREGSAPIRTGSRQLRVGVNARAGRGDRRTQASRDSPRTQIPSPAAARVLAEAEPRSPPT